MTLYLVGLGLGDEKDISVRGLEAVKKSDLVYLENYTSVLQVDVGTLSRFYGKEVVLVDRVFVENAKVLVSKAKENNVALLVVGDVFSATTHIELVLEAKKQSVALEIVPNASILNVVSFTGLQLYKFGKTASIPFFEDTYPIDSPYNVLVENLSINAHTLFLLDLDPSNDRFMSLANAIDALLKIESRKQEGVFSKDTFCVGCARLGTDKPKIVSGKAEDLMGFDFGSPPYCLIIPAVLHFHEEEVLKSARDKF